MLIPYFDAIPRRLLVSGLAVNVLVTAGVVASSLLATPIYRSEALLIPKSAFSSSTADFGSNMQASLIGLGLSGGGSKLSPFEAILKSPAVIDRFIATSGLAEAEKKDYVEDYRDLVSNIVRVDFRKDGSIAIAVEDKTPAVAQRYAQAYVDTFDTVVKGIAERTAKSQADALASIVEHTRATYGASLERVNQSRVDDSLVRQDPSMLASSLHDLEERLLVSRMKLTQLERSLASGNPEMVAARAVHQQLLDAREKLLKASPQSAGSKDTNTTFPLDAVLARQSATIVGVYTQAREKVLVDSMLASSPYTVAQYPTLPQKRVRPQRRKMIAFGVMTQALVSVGLLGIFLSLRKRRTLVAADA